MDQEKKNNGMYKKIIIYYRDSFLNCVKKRREKIGEEVLCVSWGSFPVVNGDSSILQQQQLHSSSKSFRVLFHFQGFGSALPLLRGWVPWSSSFLPKCLSFVRESLLFFLSRTTKAPFTLCLSFYTPAVISSAGINDPESDPRAMDGQYMYMETSERERHTKKRNVEEHRLWVREGCRVQHAGNPTTRRIPALPACLSTSFLLYSILQVSLFVEKGV